MHLVQLRIFTGDPAVEGEPVFVAPDNVGTVAKAMIDPPAAEVWQKVGIPMLLVEGSAEHVANLLTDGEVIRREDPLFVRARLKARAEQRGEPDPDERRRPSWRP